MKKSLSVLFILLVLFGCNATYEEGVTKANQSFTLMTPLEKQYYDIVQAKWNHSRLKHIRLAIYQIRDVAPDHRAIPFSDIPDIIQTTNQSFIYKDSWTQSYKEEYLNAKFDRIDREWYLELTTGQKFQEVKEEKEIEPKLKVSEVVKDIEQPNTLLSISEYDELIYDMRDCKEAKQLLEDIVNLGKALTNEDRDDILRKVLYCRTRTLRDQMED